MFPQSNTFRRSLSIINGQNRPNISPILVDVSAVGIVYHIFYVKDENETESALCSPFWYPMILCRKIGSADVDVVSCDSLSQARDEILKWLKGRF